MKDFLEGNQEETHQELVMEINKKNSCRILGGTPEGVARTTSAKTPEETSRGMSTKFLKKFQNITWTTSRKSSLRNFKESESSREYLEKSLEH